MDVFILWENEGQLQVSFFVEHRGQGSGGSIMHGVRGTGEHWEGDDTFFSSWGVEFWDSRHTMYIRPAINSKYT